MVSYVREIYYLCLVIFFTNKNLTKVMAKCYLRDISVLIKSRLKYKNFVIRKRMDLCKDFVKNLSF